MFYIHCAGWNRSTFCDRGIILIIDTCDNLRKCLTPIARVAI
jgi:hypothetical protein